MEDSATVRGNKFQWFCRFQWFARFVIWFLWFARLRSLWLPFAHCYQNRLFKRPGYFQIVSNTRQYKKVQNCVQLNQRFKNPNCSKMLPHQLLWLFPWALYVIYHMCHIMWDKNMKNGKKDNCHLLPSRPDSPLIVFSNTNWSCP